MEAFNAIAGVDIQLFLLIPINGRVPKLDPSHALLMSPKAAENLLCPTSSVDIRKLNGAKFQVSSLFGIIFK